MARPLSIPEKHWPAVMEKAAEGLGTREIAAWLGKTHKVKTSYGAVARLLRRTQAERREITQAVVAERVGKSVTSDLDAIDAELARLERIISAMSSGLATKDGEPGTALLDRIGQTPRAKVYGDLVARKESLLALKLKLSGATPTDDAAGVVVLPPLTDD